VGCSMLKGGEKQKRERLVCSRDYGGLMSSVRSTTERLKFIKANNFLKYIYNSQFMNIFSLNYFYYYPLVVLTAALLHISLYIANISTGLKFLYLVYVIFCLFLSSISPPLHECCLNKHFPPAIRCYSFFFHGFEVRCVLLNRKWTNEFVK